MFRLLIDEDFNNDILRGLLRRVTELDVIRVQDIGLSGAGDDLVLARAADESRIVVSHDSSTMSRVAYERVAEGANMPGVFIAPQHLGIGVAIDELEAIIKISSPAEWADRVIYLPLSE